MTDPLRPADWGEGRPWTLSEIDHETQRFCLEMHKNGIWVNQQRRQQVERVFTDRWQRREKRLVEVMRTAGMSRGQINDIIKDDAPDEDDVEADEKPGSYDQIRDLLYGPKEANGWDLGIPPGMEEKDFLTSSGLPGTGDKVLRAHLANDWLQPLQREFIEQLRLYRREKNKVVGTMLLPASRRDEHKKGLAWEDGRIRSSWNAHVVANTRLSSSKPNMTNQGSRKGSGIVKSVYEAEPGHILVGCDLSQAHLYIAANYWCIKPLQEAFAQGLDPHVMLAEEVARRGGDDYSKYQGWAEVGGYSLAKKPAKNSHALALRELCKTMRYTGMYLAGVTLRGGGRYKFVPDTLLSVVRSTEQVDDDGNSRLPYLKYQSDQVISFHDAWMAREPDWLAAWEWEVRRFEQRGYATDPIFQRRSGGLSGGKAQEVVNYPILTAEAHIMRLAEWAARQAFPFEFAGRATGVIQQVHDSLIVEIPLPKGFDPLWAPTKDMKAGKEPLPPELEKARRTLEECMSVKIPGWPLSLAADSAVGRTLADT